MLPAGSAEGTGSMNMIRRTLTGLLLSCLLLAAASTAHALTLDLSLDIDSADPGNPLAAMVGVFNSAGTGVTSGPPLGGVGFEDRPLRNGGSLTLAVGTATFTEVDDIEFSTSTDVPGAIFQDGAFTGLDYVIFFEMVAGSPVSKQWNPQCGGPLPSDCASNPDILSAQHYALNFEDDGSFSLASITGVPSSPMFDGEELQYSLDPILGAPLVTGTVSGALVPEPSLLALLGISGLAVMGSRRR